LPEKALLRGDHKRGQEQKVFVLNDFSSCPLLFDPLGWRFGAKQVRDLTAPAVRSDALLEGLVPGLLYSVRVRMATKAGLSNFSEPVTFRTR
jgi:hypothetical protein